MPFKLNKEIAAAETPHGLKVYAYIPDTEDLVANPRGESVVLDNDAQLVLLDHICSTLGACDFLLDCRRDLAEAKAEAAFYRDKSKN